MPEFQINMTEVPNEFTKLDESLLYLVRIGGAEVRKSGQQSKTPGEPYINVQLEVRRPADWEGKTMYTSLVLPMQPTPLDTIAERRRKVERGVRLKQFMDAFELPYGPAGFTTDSWVGAEAGCTVKNEENQNGDMFSSPKKFMSKSAVLAALEKLDTSTGFVGGDPVGTAAGVDAHGI